MLLPCPWEWEDLKTWQLCPHLFCLCVWVGHCPLLLQYFDNSGLVFTEIREVHAHTRNCVPLSLVDISKSHHKDVSLSSLCLFFHPPETKSMSGPPCFLLFIHPPSSPSSVQTPTHTHCLVLDFSSVNFTLCSVRLVFVHEMLLFLWRLHSVVLPAGGICLLQLFLSVLFQTFNVTVLN